MTDGAAGDGGVGAEAGVASAEAAAEAGVGPDATSACNHFFDATTSARCGRAVPPAADLAEARARYAQSCVARLELPGTSLTAASLEACAAAADATPCDATLRPAACIVSPGARADGAACSDDAQCRSTRCARRFGTAPDGGPATVPACGTCSPAGAAGEPCAAGVGDGCADGTRCVASHGARVCTAVTAVGQGEPCDDLARVCAAGLTCDSARARCVRAVPHGDTGASQIVVAWAEPGAVCGDSSPCLVGACPGSSGVCPRVLPDGAACVAFDPATTCGLSSACMDGRCAVEYSVPCP
jgi:hypothetical protein